MEYSVIFPWPFFFCQEFYISYTLSTYLGALAKLQKATIGVVMSVRLSVCMEQPGCYWADFREILYLCIFLNFVEKILNCLKYDKNSEDVTRKLTYIYDSTSLNFS